MSKTTIKTNKPNFQIQYTRHFLEQISQRNVDLSAILPLYIKLPFIPIGSEI